MLLGEHVVEDYATTGLTIKRHPLAFLRAELKREGLVAAADLATLPVERRLAIAGLVLIRQRPGSANGVVFVTLEDETGIANLIVWPATLERCRRAARRPLPCPRKSPAMIRATSSFRAGTFGKRAPERPGRLFRRAERDHL